MNETKKRIYLALIAISVAIWAFNNLQSSSKDKDSAAQPLAAASHSAAPASKALPSLAPIESKPWAADPFNHGRSRNSISRTTSSPSKQANEFVLKAIIFSKTAPSAFLNNRVVRPGDIIDGAKVIKISKRAVTLQENGREFIVTVKRG